jgi:hypothetical protein
MKSVEKNKLRRDFYVVCTIILLTFITSILINIDLFYLVLMYLLLPSMYLILRKKKDLVRICIASLTLGVFYGMSYNFIAEYFHAYQTIYANPYHAWKIVGVTPIADILWGFLIPFSIIVFYEHFLDRHKKLNSYSKKSLFFVSFGAILFLVISVYLNLYSIQSYPRQYAYFIVGLISSLPLILLFFEKHHLLYKIYYCSLYYFILNILFEVSAFVNNSWVFLGHYFYQINIGGWIFPIEEFIFWIVPSTAVFLILYEYIFDDNR